MNKRNTLHRKRRIIARTASMAPPFHAASLGIALGMLLSTAKSFSIGNHRQLVHTPKEQMQTLSQASTRSQASTNAFLPDTARLGSTSLPYLSYDLEFGPNTGDSTNLKQQNQKKASTRVLNTDAFPRHESSLSFEGISDETETFQENWKGLSNSNIKNSSPSSFALSWSLFVPKGVSASFLNNNSNDKPSPLVLTPDRKNRLLGEAASSAFLRSFLQTNQEWIDQQILEYGGIVFRDFGGAENIKGNGNGKMTTMGKEILRAFNSDKISANNNNEGSRKGFEFYLVSNDDDSRSMPISISSVGKRIEQFTAKGSKPLRLSEISAQMRITDWRGIHSDLNPNLRKKLEENHLLYKRTHLVQAEFPNDLIPTPKNNSDSDSDSDATNERDTVTTMLNGVTAVVTKPSLYCRLFGSTNRKVLSKTYQKMKEKMAYRSEERTFVCEAFRRHPQTNEKIWFELAHRFHWTSLPAELLSEFKRTKNPWTLARAVREATVGLWKRLHRRSSNPLFVSWKQQLEPETETTTVSFGDGTPVSWWEVHQIRRAIEKNTAQYPWKLGDILVVDGLSMGVN